MPPAPPARPVRPGVPGSGRPEGRKHGAGAGAGFWIVGFAFAVAMAFSTVPAPLYVLYQARDQFSALLVTVIFAAYAVGVIASLFLAGHISDWLGRRRMAVVALAINMLSGLIFLAWPSVPGLIAGRAICGVSIGMLTATATAYRANCTRQRGPASPRRGPRSPRPPPTSAASASARCWPACWPSTRGRRCGCRIW